MKITEQQAVKLYQHGLTIKEISQLGECRQQTISKILKKHNLHVASKNQYRLPYSLNHKYFQTIDSANKAYLLGLLYADGSVSKTTNQITLVSTDKELVDFFKKELNLEKELYQNPSHKNAYTVCFSSRDMKLDLMKLGCFPQKSLLLQFPSYQQVSNDFVWDFLRGYFDGDGSVYISNNQKQAYFLGTYDFLKQAEQLLYEEGVTTNKIKKNQNIWRLFITGKKSLNKLWYLLYNQSQGFGLTRKEKKLCPHFTSTNIPKQTNILKLFKP